MSAYKIAISLTTQAIDDRARYFRNQIVSVVMFGAACIGGAVLSRALCPIGMLLLLFPLCGAFVLMDGRVLNVWRNRLMASWVVGEIDFQPYREAMNAMPTLPKATLQGMLQSLPSTPDWATEQAASTGTRELVAAVVRTVHACRSDTMALKVAGALIVAVAGTVAVQEWRALFFLPVVVMLPSVSTRLKRWRLRKLDLLISEFRTKPGFPDKPCRCLLESLDWHPISKSERISVILTL